MTTTSLYRSHSPPVVLIPLCVGTAIYKVNNTVLVKLNHNVTWLPVVKWILQSLPNGLWLFALLNVYRLYYRKHSFYQNLLWLSMITLLAFTTEYLQAFHVVKGTFDLLDLLFYEFACIATTYIAFNTHLDNLFTNSKKKQAF